MKMPCLGQIAVAGALALTIGCHKGKADLYRDFIPNQEGAHNVQVTINKGRFPGWYDVRVLHPGYGDIRGEVYGKGYAIQAADWGQLQACSWNTQKCIPEEKLNYDEKQVFRKLLVEYSTLAFADIGKAQSGKE